MLATNRAGFFPYTPATNLLFGLREAIAMLHEEGLESVFARHARHASATRAAVNARSLEFLSPRPARMLQCADRGRHAEGHDAGSVARNHSAPLRHVARRRLTKLKRRVFRIGHLGGLNDLMLMGALSGVEMGLTLAGAPHKRGGVDAALSFLGGEPEIVRPATQAASVA